MPQLSPLEPPSQCHMLLGGLGVSHARLNARGALRTQLPVPFLSFLSLCMHLQSRIARTIFPQQKHVPSSRCLGVLLPCASPVSPVRAAGAGPVITGAISTGYISGLFLLLVLLFLLGHWQLYPFSPGCAISPRSFKRDRLLSQLLFCRHSVTDCRSPGESPAAHCRYRNSVSIG